MTRITNLRPGCVGIDLQPPLRPMRREDDRLPWLADDRYETIFTRRRRRADRRFCILFAVCVVGYLMAEAVSLCLHLTGHGSM